MNFIMNSIFSSFKSLTLDFLQFILIDISFKTFYYQSIAYYFKNKSTRKNVQFFCIFNPVFWYLNSTYLYLLKLTLYEDLSWLFNFLFSISYTFISFCFSVSSYMIFHCIDCFIWKLYSALQFFLLAVKCNSQRLTLKVISYYEYSKHQYMFFR